METHSIPLQQLAMTSTQNTRSQAQNTRSEFVAASTAMAYEHPVTDNTEEGINNKTEKKSATPIEDTEEETMITSNIQEQIRILEKRLEHYVDWFLMSVSFVGIGETCN